MRTPLLVSGSDRPHVDRRRPSR